MRWQKCPYVMEPACSKPPGLLAIKLFGCHRARVRIRAKFAVEWV
jgi:hypothetical protein